MIIDDGLWEQTRRAWPGVSVPRDVFEAFVVARCSTPEDGRQRPPFQPKILADLYLALACGRGDAAAIERFGAQFGEVIERVRKRFGPRAPAREELLADLHERLFVPRPGAQARIFEYGGQSELGTWVKVVVTRILLNRLAATKPEEPVEDRILETLSVVWNDSERLLDRQESRAYFRDAFARAVRALPTRQRQILRLAFAEGFTIDDLGELYGVHRTTAFRRLQQASIDLASNLRRTVRTELRMTDTAYERWCESLRSGLELSLQRFFGTNG